MYSSSAVQFPAAARDAFFSTASAPASCAMGIGVPPPHPGVKRLGREAHNSPPSGTEMYEQGAIPLQARSFPCHSAIKSHTGINYYLSLWSSALFESPSLRKPLDSFPAFYGTRRFITEFTKALCLFLS
jgi:hypothetical protein